MTNYMAGGDIRVCRFVNLSAAHTVVEADANEIIHGIAQEGSGDPPIPGASALAAVSGDQPRIFQEGEDCLLELAADVATVGLRLKSDADGLGTPIATSGTTIQHWGAVALQTGVAGDRIRVKVQIGSERPALS